MIGRGPQTLLDSAAALAARGGAGRTMRENIAAKQLLEAAGRIGDGSSVDGRSITGLEPFDYLLGIPEARPRNVTDYGVVMDGVTNNLAAFNAARASALINGTIDVPRGSTLFPNGISAGLTTPVLWRLDGTTFPGGITAITDIGKPGDLTEAYLNGGKYFGRRRSLKDSGPAVRVDMIITDATGGNVNNVANGINVITQQNLGNTNSVWGLGVVGDCYADTDAGGMVGIQSTVRKHAGSFAWAIQSVTLDDTGLASSANGHGFVGAEIAVRANNLDDAGNSESYGGVGTRNAIHLTLNRSNAALDNLSSFSHAIWISGDTDATKSFVGSVYAVGNSMKTYSVFDSRGAGVPFGYTGPVAAVRMLHDHIVDFNGGAALDSDAGAYLQYRAATSRLYYVVAGVDKFSIDASGNVRAAGTLTGSTTP